MSLDVTALARALVAEGITVPIMACSTGGDPDLAVRAIRLGARRVLSLHAHPDLASTPLAGMPGENPDLIARDPAMVAAIRRAEQVAPSDASVLIYGES